MAYFARAVHSHPPFPVDNAFSMGSLGKKTLFNEVILPVKTVIS